MSTLVGKTDGTQVIACVLVLPIGKGKENIVFIVEMKKRREGDSG